MMTVTPFSARALMRSQKSRRARGSAPEVGSSRKRMSGEWSRGARHAEALLIAAGQVRGGGVHVRSQVKFFFHGADGFLPLLSGHAVGPGEEFQVLTRGQHAVHGEFLGA